MNRSTHILKTVEEMQRAFARLGYISMPIWSKFTDLMDRMRAEAAAEAQEEAVAAQKEGK